MTNNNQTTDEHAQPETEDGKQEEEEEVRMERNDEGKEEKDIDRDLLKEGPRKVKVTRGSPEEKEFWKQTMQRELKGLLDDGTLKSIHVSKIRGNTSIFGSRFVEYLKKGDQDLKKNSQLVSNNYSEEAAP